MSKKSVFQIIKSAFCAAISAVMLVVSVPVSVGAASSGAKLSQSVIVVSDDAPSTVSYAAQKLADYLGQILGKELEIVSDEAETDGYKIIVSNSENDNQANGSYTIVSDSQRLVISGSGNKGTINGVYAFLEKYCSCHWYESEVIVIPENASLEIPLDINDSYTPYFEYTETDTASSRDIEFSLANGLVGGVYRDFTEEQGDEVGYIGQFAHTLTTVFCKADTYFAEHPEYFALRDGKRNP